ncbi:MAG: hypothetical protein JWL85_48, partial [Candidatus Saccharibacteria bacterium]|nr:hypothetical protein [Candidatus Saccharibacteria bacterium]
MKMATNSGKDNKSVFDVSKPGKTAANASSRPLILGHKTMVQDHTMVGPEVEKKEEAAPEVPEEPMKLPTRSKTITPPSEEKETPPKPANDSSQEPEVNPQDLSSSESAVVDAIAEQAAGKKKDGNVSKEDKEKQKALDKLIEDKTYFLNITPPARKRNMRAAVISLVIVLVGVVGLAAAADAEILNLGFKPPFDFIKKDTKQTAAIVPAVAVPAVVPTPKATTPAVTVPDGYVEYTNKELGFKFAYP